MAAFFLKKDPFEKTLAIDIGTASLVGALSRRRRVSAEAPEVLKVFRYPLDVLGRDSTRFYTAKLTKLFEEAHGAEHSIDRIRLVFSSPLFLEKVVQKRFVRPRPHAAITGDELKESVLAAEDLAAGAGENMVVASRAVRSINVNGYPVAHAEGYKGKFLDIEMECLFINSFFGKFIAEIRDTFFPKSELSYHADSAVTIGGIEHMFAEPRPLVVVDVGGEVTAACVSKDHGREHGEPVPFGVRTLERRIAGFLQLERSDAEAVLRKFSAGTLDPAMQRRVERVIASAMEDWWAVTKKSLEPMKITTPRLVAITGGGADITLFPRVLASGWRQLYGYEITPEVLKAEALREYFISMGSLGGGGDFMLASLLLA